MKKQIRNIEMKMIFILTVIFIIILFSSCTPNITVVQDKNGKIYELIDNHNLFSISDTLVMKSVYSNLPEQHKIEGIYNGYIPENYFSPNPKSNFHIIYKKVTKIKTK